MLKVLDYLIVAFLIITSKTVFGGIIYANISFLVLVILLSIKLVWKKKINLNKENILIWLIIIVEIGISVITHRKDLDNFYLRIVLYTIIGIVTASTIKGKSFVEKYVNLMVTMSVISLFFYILMWISPNLSLKFANRYTVNSLVYIANPLYTYSQANLGYENYNFSRNSGMFWEPGAYQAFLIIAFIFLLYDKQRKSNIKAIILTIALLTTKSTTGYILFLIIILTNWRRIKQYILYGRTENQQKFIYILLVGIIFIGIVYVTMSDVIYGKFSAANTSFIIRTRDFWASLVLIKEYPLFGLGVGERMVLAEREVGIVRNSCGLLYNAYCLGVIYVITYLINLKKTIAGLIQGTRCEMWFIFLIFVILMLTEGLCNLSFFFVFYFRFNKFDKDYSTDNGE